MVSFVYVAFSFCVCSSILQVVEVRWVVQVVTR